MRHVVSVVNNTFANDAGKATSFVRAKVATKVWLLNNLFVGAGTPLSLGTGAQAADKKDEGNLQAQGTVLVDRAAYDYHLRPGSAPVDKGVSPGKVNGFGLRPLSQYVHPASAETRPQVGILDVGAYEWGTPPLPSDGGAGRGRRARWRWRRRRSGCAR